ncbi:hypothetical protein [Alkalihalobacterium bogoriense]|uniref:hypothetical protein n=1 Tax=Alkalihalobacterium bogoriense TaxID=246272 RepID=UPI0006864592|nr:hypothetical protein [Alkalihalobacterium bogoriense]
MAKVKPKKNPLFPIASGVLAMTVPFFGLIFGIIGVRSSKKVMMVIQERKEGISQTAVIGLICSLIGMVLQGLLLLVVVGYFLFENPETMKGWWFL